MDTIFARSSGALPSAIAIVRISGPQAFTVAGVLTDTVPPPRQAARRKLRDPRDGSLIDHGLMLAFRGPGSATGEDCIELHVHGGKAVVHALESVLAAQPGLRPAQPGEFTRRALMNGRLDLTATEGLADLLAAETDQQRRAALAVAEGGLRRLAETWTDALLSLAARVEMQLDFVEDDNELDDASALRKEAATLGSKMRALLVQPPVERLRDGIRVVLAGPPNSGKSTLLNALVEQDAAIVSPIAGTTRDRIDVPVVRNGIAYLITDTAGIGHATTDPIEQIGMDRALQAIAVADILLWLDDVPPSDADAIWLLPKADLGDRSPRLEPQRLPISAQTRLGVEELWYCLEQRSLNMLPAVDVVATNVRQREVLTRCARALEAAALESDLILVAEELRLACRVLDELVGRSNVEAMLDSLFAGFCIGK